MNKKELAQRAAKILRINNYKKPVHLPKQTMQVTLGDRSTSFAIKPLDREVLYTVDDVEIVLDAVLAAIADGLKNGEETSLYGFGSFITQLIPQRKIHHVLTHEMVDLPPAYIPYFKCGPELKRAAAVYTARLREGPNPFFVDTEMEEFDPDDPNEPEMQMTGDDADA